METNAAGTVTVNPYLSACTGYEATAGMDVMTDERQSSIAAISETSNVMMRFPFGRLAIRCSTEGTTRSNQICAVSQILKRYFRSAPGYRDESQSIHHSLWSVTTAPARKPIAASSGQP